MGRAALLLAVLALAGCGGSGYDAEPVDPVEYEVRLAPLDDLVWGAMRLQQPAAGGLRDLAEVLVDTNPPPGAESANVVLVEVLRSFAEGVEAGDRLTLSRSMERLSEVASWLRDAGIEPYDGADGGFGGRPLLPPDTRVQEVSGDVGDGDVHDRDGVRRRGGGRVTPSAAAPPPAAS